MTINDSIHFHPDRTFGGVGFFVVTGPARDGRSPGIYLMDQATRQWRLAYDFADLPPRQWVPIGDWSGVVLPFQLYVINDHLVAARWIGRDGASVPPGQWDITGGPSPGELDVARKEHDRIMHNLGRM